MALENSGRPSGFHTPSPVTVIIMFLLFQLILLGGLPLQATAAHKGGKDEHRQTKEVSLKKIMETLTNKLELNQGQIAEVQPIMKNFLTQSKQLQEEAMGGRHSGKGGNSGKQMATLVQETMDQIDVFLNEEQSEKFKELVQSLTRKEGLKKLFS